MKIVFDQGTPAPLRYALEEQVPHTELWEGEDIKRYLQHTAQSLLGQNLLR